MTEKEPRKGLSSSQAPATIANDPATAGALALRSAKADLIVTRGGRLHRVARQVELSLNRKQIYTLERTNDKDKPPKSWTITAEGFQACNGVAGAQIVTAPTVAVDGQDMGNPYVRRDEFGKIIEVFLRMAIVARSESGNLLRLFQTLHYNPELYFRRDIWQAVKRGEHWDNQARRYVDDEEWKDAGRPVRRSAVVEAGGKLLVSGVEIDDAVAFYPVDEAFGILVDLASSDVSKVISTRNENQIFAVRKATTILQRRLCQAHPGLPPQHLTGDQVEITWGTKGKGDYAKDVPLEAIARVPVMGWIETMGAMDEAEEALRQVEAGEEDLTGASLDLGDRSTVDADDQEKLREADVTSGATAPAKGEDLDHLDLAHRVSQMMAKVKRLGGGGARVKDLVENVLQHTGTGGDLVLPEFETARLEEMENALMVAFTELKRAEHDRKNTKTDEGGRSADGLFDGEKK